MMEGQPGKRDIHGSAPVLARISGLSADTIATFATGLCEVEVSHLQAIRAELAQARAELVDHLHAAIPGAPLPLRRALLAAKRDVFNDRGLERHRCAAYWEELRRFAGPFFDSVDRLEGDLIFHAAELEAAYTHIREREWRRLLALLDNPSLLRGIALASPVLVESLQRYRDLAGFQRDSRIEASLLRYASRAALKLSPYSTLTCSALGKARDDLPTEGLRLLGQDWSQRSLVRLKRYSLSQITEMLRRYPLVREVLQVGLNSSAEEVAPGRYRFLNPASWVLEPDGGRICSVLPAIVTASLEGPVASWLWRALPERSVTWAELTAWLNTELPGEQNTEEMEKLLQLGFLRCLWPWPANEGHLEKCLLGFLRALSDARLQVVVERLGHLVALEEGFRTTSDPARSVLEIERLLDQTWEAVLELLALAPEIRRPRVKKGEIYEDVLLIPSRESSTTEIVEVPAVSMREAASAIDPILRLTHLFHPRHDFLHALGATMAERWPGRREVGVLELLSTIQPLWREHARFFASVRSADGWRETFNPLALQRLEELAFLRTQVWEKAIASVRSVGGESRICPRILTEALEQVPEAYSPPVGACLLLQPADGTGRHWMVNRIFEGTGRYGSRFTSLLDESTRNAYTGHFTARSRVEWLGEEIELLDLFSNQGDTLNVHAVQTRHVLELPGEEIGGPERRLRLADLRIRLHEKTGMPILVDVSGRGYLPVFLGGASQELLPVPLKLLSLFGPAEVRPLLPPSRERREGAAVVRERLSLQNLVLSRKRWMIPQAALPEKVGRLTEAAAFAAINHWRSELGIPDRIFVIEKVSRSPVEVFKPQYIDFTSPLFVEIFRSILQAVSGVIKIEEVLPMTETMLRDAKGVRWGVEILLDSLAFREEIKYSHEPGSSTVTAGAGDVEVVKFASSPLH
jgi:hypothetical protein